MLAISLLCFRSGTYGGRNDGFSLVGGDGLNGRNDSNGRDGPSGRDGTSVDGGDGVNGTDSGDGSDGTDGGDGATTGAEGGGVEADDGAGADGGAGAAEALGETGPVTALLTTTLPTTLAGLNRPPTAGLTRLGTRPVVPGLNNDGDNLTFATGADATADTFAREGDRSTKGLPTFMLRIAVEAFALGDTGLAIVFASAPAPIDRS